MRVTHLFLYCIAVIAITTYTQSTYQTYITIPNSNHLTKVVFTQDQTWAVFYSPNSKHIEIYKAYNFQIAYPNQTFQLQVEPKSLQLMATQSTLSLIYGCVDGSIIKVQMPGQVEQLLNNVHCPIKRLQLSDDNQNYAVICEEDSKVYTGKVEQIKGELQILDFKTTVNSLIWKPKSKEIAICGGVDNNLINSVIIYNVETKQVFNFTDLISKAVLDIAFSADGQQLAFIESEPTNGQQQFVYIVDLNTKLIDNLVATGTIKLQSLQRAGDFLSAKDSSSVYVWKFNDNNFGKYNSSLSGSGLTSDGTGIITISLNIQQFTLLKICPTQTKIYISQQDYCVPCSLPCQTCFLNEQHCSTCMDSTFLTDTFKCLDCVQNCKTCKDSVSCDQCFDSYYFSAQKQCKLCNDTLTGCINCTDSQTCTTCNFNDNWVLNLNKQCKCNNKFIQIGNICQKCPLGCWKCLNINICQTCDRTQNWDIVPIEGKCLCQEGYFTNNQKCQSCMLGCQNCLQVTSCKKCNVTQNWQINGNICVCQQGFLQLNQLCASCQSLIQGCQFCSSFDVCTTCKSDYQSNSVRKCQKIPQSNILIIVMVGIIIAIGLAMGGYFIVRHYRKLKLKKDKSLINSDSQIYQSVQTHAATDTK